MALEHSPKLRAHNNLEGINISPIVFPDSFNKCVSRAWDVPGTTISSEDVAVWGGWGGGF